MHLRARQFEDLIVLYCVDDKEKELQVPKEQCSDTELLYPSQSSIDYWKAFGLDRTTFGKLFRR